MSGSGSRQRAEARLGRRIADKYKLMAVLGSGGMGAVYEAHHAFTNRRVALKLLHASVAAIPLAARRFLQEAKAAGAVKHPSIADILDAGREPDGTLYVVFELLNGEDLATAIKERRVGARRLVETAVQVLEGLEVAHEANIVHRDIKPANIFLVREASGQTRAKILDFGVARILPPAGGENLTQAGMVVGTPYYMSPEQMCGEEVDGRADLWSLAVVLYLALSGQLPFAAKNHAALVSEMMRSGPPSLSALRPDLPVSLAEAVCRSLNPEITARHQNAREMRQALEVARQDLDPKVPVGGEADRASLVSTDRLVRQRAPMKLEPPRPAWERALGDIEEEIERLEHRSAPTALEEKSSIADRLNPFKRRKR